MKNLRVKHTFYYFKRLKQYPWHFLVGLTVVDSNRHDDHNTFMLQYYKNIPEIMWYELRPGGELLKSDNMSILANFSLIMMSRIFLPKAYLNTFHISTTMKLINLVSIRSMLFCVMCTSMHHVICVIKYEIQFKT